MRSHPEWLRELARDMGCQLEYRWIGYDIKCLEKRYLVRPLNRGCRVTLTYLAVREAERFKPALLVVKLAEGSAKPVAEIDYSDWHGMVFGYGSKKLYLVSEGCELKISYVPGLKGRRISIIVSERTYDRWLELVRTEKKNWEDIIDYLLSHYSY